MSTPQRGINTRPESQAKAEKPPFLQIKEGRSFVKIAKPKHRPAIVGFPAIEPTKTWICVSLLDPSKSL